MITTKRSYGFHPVGGLVETPAGDYAPVRLGLDGGDLVAIDGAGEVVMRASGHKDGWYFRHGGERFRLAPRWQRAGGALLAREARNA